MDRTPKGDVIMVIGDFNAKVGHHKGGDGDTIGEHGLGQRCTTFLGQGPQCIIFSALEGLNQNY